MKLKLLVAFLSTAGVASIAVAADLPTPPVNAGTAVSAADVQKPDINDTHAAKPEIETPDMEKPEVEKPEIEKPEIEKPDMEKPDMEKPDIQKPNVEKD